MAIEDGFHKLADPADYESIAVSGFRPSTPAAKHWLGEGVYFFLDPNGLKWAQKWPLNSSNPRTGSSIGIVRAEIDTLEVLDLRNNEIRLQTQLVVNDLRSRLKRLQKPYSDGLAFALLRNGGFRRIVDYVPTGVVANFDDIYRGYRVGGSRVFTTLTEMEVHDGTAQIQACVTDLEIIRFHLLVS